MIRRLDYFLLEIESLHLLIYEYFLFGIYLVKFFVPKVVKVVLWVAEFFFHLLYMLCKANSLLRILLARFETRLTLLKRLIFKWNQFFLFLHIPPYLYIWLNFLNYTVSTNILTSISFWDNHFLQLKFLMINVFHLVYVLITTYFFLFILVLRS